jgi:enoyl-CoA hydratase
MLRKSCVSLSELVTCSVKPISRAGAPGNIATITLNHPVSRNSMTVGMGEQFVEIVSALRKDPSIKGAILTGSNGVFSAGGDAVFLRERLTSTPEQNYAAMRAFYDRFLSVRTLQCPVVAALNGPAIGAGLCVALACDFRVADEKAKMGVNFVRVGIHPGMGASWTLPRLVGHATASRLMLTGDVITGAEAKALGLVVDATSGGEEAVIKRATEIVEAAATASRVAVLETLKTLRGDPEELNRALDREAKAQAVCYADGDDLAEAMSALKEKRQPSFKK